MGWNKCEITATQQRILDLLSDGKPHALIVELREKGHFNQFPALDALERKKLIRFVVEDVHYLKWELVKE